MSQCGAACSRGTQQGLEATASLRSLHCEAAASVPIESHEHPTSSPKEHHPSVLVLLLGCFLFQYQIASGNSKKEIQKNLLYMDVSSQIWIFLSGESVS